jgi:hypothetical protein
MHWTSGFGSTLQVDEALERNCVDMTMEKEDHFLYTFFLQHKNTLSTLFLYLRERERGTKRKSNKVMMI